MNPRFDRLRDTTRAEGALGTPTQRHISPSILVDGDCSQCTEFQGYELIEFHQILRDRTEAGSYLRLVDFLVSLHSGNDSNKEEEERTGPHPTDAIYALARANVCEKEISGPPLFLADVGEAAYVYTYTYIHTHICISIFIYINIYIYICMCVFVLSASFLCTSPPRRQHVCVCCTDVYIYTYIYVHICIYIYIYIILYILCAARMLGCGSHRVPGARVVET